MRTKILSKLTNHEVEEYLKKNDLIIVAVGTVEMHGGLPLDCETVVSEAFALKMAEKTDALVLTNLPYFYAGATASGRGTVQVSVRSGIDYLMEIAKSLLRQGFKRQIYVSFHGPAHMTCSPVMRDFFDETKVPILYLDMIMGLSKALSTAAPHGFEVINSLFYAGYDVMGRLEDIPLTPEIGEDFSIPWESTVRPFDSFLSGLSYQSGGYGYYFGDPRDHAPTPRADTPEQRADLAAQGTRLMDQIIESLDVPQVAEKMRDVEAFVKEVVVPRCQDWLP